MPLVSSSVLFVMSDREQDVYSIVFVQLFVFEPIGSTSSVPCHSVTSFSFFLMARGSPFFCCCSVGSGCFHVIFLRFNDFSRQVCEFRVCSTNPRLEIEKTRRIEVFLCRLSLWFMFNLPLRAFLLVA